MRFLSVTMARFNFFLCLLLVLWQAKAAVYEASEYFVAPQMWDNSQRLQILVDKVHAEGGGTIQVLPEGRFCAKLRPEGGWHDIRKDGTTYKQ